MLQNPNSNSGGPFIIGPYSRSVMEASKKPLGTPQPSSDNLGFRVKGSRLCSSSAPGKAAQSQQEHDNMLRKARHVGVLERFQKHSFRILQGFHYNPKP